MIFFIRVLIWLRFFVWLSIVAQRCIGYRYMQTNLAQLTAPLKLVNKLFVKSSLIAYAFTALY
jgi:hypothetical protein